MRKPDPYTPEETREIMRKERAKSVFELVWQFGLMITLLLVAIKIIVSC